ncbi:MAG: SDR family NAD(P)-dependent oxidoreductase, partial [Candidatus Aminicenantes bacterium]
KEILYPSSVSSVSSVAKDINQTEIAQPLIFIIEYALAKLLMKWGIKPAAMIGHSIGEYTAACLAGVFSLEDALKIVSLRGRLMQQVPPGAMVSMSLSEEELKPLLNGDISLAAVNSPHHSVVSGPQPVVKEFETLLKKKGYQTRRLHTSHAFHSKMMDSILGEFGEQVSQIKLNKPQEPFLSNLTGQWITDQQAADPAYWVKHLRRTVRFSDGINEMLKKKISVFVEVGPGNSLSTLVRQSTDKETGPLGVNLLRHPKEDATDDGYLLDKIGQLWLYGVPINWRSFYNGEPGQRLPLPTYPFEGQPYRMDGNLFKAGDQGFPGKFKLQKKTDMADWFYVPVWKQSFVPTPPKGKEVDEYCWLLFPDECGLGTQLANRLEHDGAEVIVVRAGSGFIKKNETEYTINPANSGDYEVLLREVLKRSKPLKITHLWGVTGLTPLSIESLLQQLDETQNRGIFSLVFLVQALGREEISEEIFIEVVTNNMQKVVGEEVLCPEKATLSGAVKVIAKEYPQLNCRSIDVTLPQPPGNDYGKLLDSLFSELREKSSEMMVAYRYNMRWVQAFEPVRLEETCKQTAILRHQGVYLITGGLGGIGLEVARYLAKSVQAKLVLTGRSPFPARGGWEQWFQAHGPDNDVSQKIKKLQEMEALGAEILVVSADVADLTQMQRVAAQAETCFGRINGIIHSAGLADYAGVIQRRSKETTEKILAAKVKGTLVLERVFKDVKLDFFILCSSLSSIVGPFGEVGYTAANAFLDAFAYYCNSLGDSPWGRTVSINWTAWRETGMAVEAIKRKSGTRTVDLDEGILSAEGVEIFHRIIGANLPQVAVFTRDLNTVLEMLNKQEYDVPGLVGTARESESRTVLQKRPGLSIAYVAPGNEIEQTLAYIWQDFFGIEPIGINDDFFELGGDSLRAAALLARIHKEMNLAVPVTAFFNQSTIKGLVRYHAKKTREKSDYFSIEKAEEKEYYALSPAQKRLFILHQMEPGRPVYNMPEVVVLEGDFDREIMERAFKELIRRHESLRTSFEVIGTGPVQKIQDTVEFEIEYYDLYRTQVKVEVKAEVEEGEGTRGLAPLLKNFIRPFDLSQGPLMRVGLIKIDENQHILAADMHHIVSDGISMGLLVSEFLALYRGETLPVLKLQYKDFSQWQNQRFLAGEIKTQEEYWLKEFETGVPVLRLPTDYPRPEIQSFEGNIMGFDLGQEMIMKLKKFAREEDITLFVLLLAVYNVFLFKISGLEDIVVGTVAAGRRHADLERVIGMFVNTLALRNHLNREKPFVEFLYQVKKQTLDAFDNQDYQFDDLVEKLLPNRDSSRNPLFDVMFTYTSREFLIPSQEASTPGKPVLNARAYEFEFKDSKFDMILGVWEWQEKLEFVIQYSTKLFKASTIEKFIKYFKHILSSVIEDRFTRLKEITIPHDLKALKSDVYQRIASDFEF